MTSQQMRNLPQVAVCLAAHQGIRCLPEQLISIVDQQDVNVTVYISVDHSTDGTEAWIDTFAQQDKRIIPLPHAMVFGGAARNFFRLIRDVDFSNFDYVSLADQDDIWHSNKLIRAISVLRQSGAAGYSSNVIAFWPSGREVLIKKSQPQRHRDFLFEAAGPGCTYLMSVDLVRALRQEIIQNWDAIQSVNLHDWFIYAWARAHQFHWIIDPRPGMLYRQHANNQFGVNRGVRATLARIRKVWNGWWFEQASVIARLIGMEHDAYAQALQRRRYLWLACHAGQCRRRFRDKIAFVCFCLLLCCKVHRRS